MYFFEKKVYALYNGVWGKTPEAGEFSTIFVLKVTLQSVGLYIYGGAGCTSCSPIILLGVLLLLLPWFPRL